MGWLQRRLRVAPMPWILPQGWVRTTTPLVSTGNGPYDRAPSLCMAPDAVHHTLRGGRWQGTPLVPAEQLKHV